MQELRKVVIPWGRRWLSEDRELYSRTTDVSKRQKKAWIYNLRDYAKHEPLCDKPRREDKGVFWRWLKENIDKFAKQN